MGYRQCLSARYVSFIVYAEERPYPILRCKQKLHNCFRLRFEICETIFLFSNKKWKTFDDTVEIEILDPELRTREAVGERLNHTGIQHTLCFQYYINKYYSMALTISLFHNILLDLDGKHMIVDFTTHRT